MFRWKSPDARFVRPGPIGLPQGRLVGGPHAEDHSGYVHNPNWPIGIGHEIAMNERPELVGWGYVGVFDVKPERGEMIAARIRSELDRPLARRIKDFFRIKVVLPPREATVSDVRSLHGHDVVVAVLGKGGEATAIKLFETAVESLHCRIDFPATKARTINAFTSTGEGVAVHGVAVVPVPTMSLFGVDDVLIGNLAVHEFGHAISRLGSDGRDHETGGVMQPVTGTNESALHYTEAFLEQF